MTVRARSGPTTRRAPHRCQMRRQRQMPTHCHRPDHRDGSGRCQKCYGHSLTCLACRLSASDRHFDSLPLPA